MKRGQHLDEEHGSADKKPVSIDPKTISFAEWKHARSGNIREMETRDKLKHVMNGNT